MNRIHRSTTVIAGLVVSIVGLVAAAPAAFAMRPVDPGGTGPYPTPVTVIHSGVSTWQVTLIAVLTAVGAALATAIALKVRGRTRKLHPATG